MNQMSAVTSQTRTAHGQLSPARGWKPAKGSGTLRLAAIAAAHVGLAAAAWQVVLRPEPHLPELLRVVIVDAARPELPLPRIPQPQPPRWQAPQIQAPEVVLQRPPEPDVRPNVVAVLPATTPVQTPPPEAPRVAAAPPPPPPPPAPPAPPAPRQLPSSAVAYRVPPPIEVPLASRRLGEQGTVWLRVWVGVDGAPRQVTVQTSSGFTRLDEQALWAMRRARFKPQVENGQPVEWIVVAPLQYEIG